MEKWNSFRIHKNFIKKLDRVIFGHFVPRLGKDWSKSDSKWPKTQYQVYSASQDLCSSSHEEQNIFMLKFMQLALKP